MGFIWDRIYVTRAIFLLSCFLGTKQEHDSTNEKGALVLPDSNWAEPITATYWLLLYHLNLLSPRFQDKWCLHHCGNNKGLLILIILNLRLYIYIYICLGLQMKICQKKKLWYINLNHCAHINECTLSLLNKYKLKLKLDVNYKLLITECS